MTSARGVTESGGDECERTGPEHRHPNVNNDDPSVVGAVSQAKNPDQPVIT